MENQIEVNLVDKLIRDDDDNEQFWSVKLFVLNLISSISCPCVHVSDE